MSDMFWKKCSTCKKEIGFKSTYWSCNVSTCNGKRTGLVFCSVPCFERHLPGARHKDAYAVEEKSPQTQSHAPQSTTRESLVSSAPQQPKRIIVGTTAGNSTTSSPSIPKETLIVVSKLKEYIDQKSGMNTSANCIPLLSDFIRLQCDLAIENARQEGRKTVLDRDFNTRKKL